MRSNSTKKLAIAAIFVALAVVGSAFVSFPVFGSKCSPTQHMVNVLCAVFLGPGYGVGVAFCASLIRNLVGAGTLMAFPGSMVGALCCGLAYKALRNKNEVAAILVTLVNGDAATLAVTAYIIPFLISTVAGSIIAGVLVFALRAGGALKILQRSLELK